jgi:hypothetical protein
LGLFIYAKTQKKTEEEKKEKSLENCLLLFVIGRAAIFQKGLLL